MKVYLVLVFTSLAVSLTLAKSVPIEIGEELNWPDIRTLLDRKKRDLTNQEQLNNQNAQTQEMALQPEITGQSENSQDQTNAHENLSNGQQQQQQQQQEPNANLNNQNGHTEQHAASLNAVDASQPVPIESGHNSQDQSNAHQNIPNGQQENLQPNASPNNQNSPAQQHATPLNTNDQQQQPTGGQYFPTVLQPTPSTPSQQNQMAVNPNYPNNQPQQYPNQVPPQQNASPNNQNSPAQQHTTPLNTNDRQQQPTGGQYFPTVSQPTPSTPSQQNQMAVNPNYPNVQPQQYPNQVPPQQAYPSQYAPINPQQPYNYYNPNVQPTFIPTQQNPTPHLPPTAYPNNPNRQPQQYPYPMPPQQAYPSQYVPINPQQPYNYYNPNMQTTFFPNQQNPTPRLTPFAYPNFANGQPQQYPSQINPQVHPAQHAPNNPQQPNNSYNPNVQPTFIPNQQNPTSHLSPTAYPNNPNGQPQQYPNPMPSQQVYPSKYVPNNPQQTYNYYNPNMQTTFFPNQQNPQSPTTGYLNISNGQLLQYPKQYPLFAQKQEYPAQNIPNVPQQQNGGQISPNSNEMNSFLDFLLSLDEESLHKYAQRPLRTVQASSSSQVNNNSNTQKDLISLLESMKDKVQAESAKEKYDGVMHKLLRRYEHCLYKLRNATGYMTFGLSEKFLNRIENMLS